MKNSLLYMDFGIALIAYFFAKIGYMVLYNNFIQLLSLKGKKTKGTYLERFSKVLGYSLVALGIITALLIFLKRVLPGYYLHIYGTIIFGVCAFLLITFFSYKNEERV